MSKSSEAHIPQETLEQYDTKLKEQKMEVKTSKLIVTKAVIEKIVPLPSKYGKSWRLESGNKNYYYNAKEDIIDKMFQVGRIAAFTTKMTPPNKYGKSYELIDSVLYTFD